HAGAGSRLPVCQTVGHPAARRTERKGVSLRAGVLALYPGARGYIGAPDAESARDDATRLIEETSMTATQRCALGLVAVFLTACAKHRNRQGVGGRGVPVSGHEVGRRVSGTGSTLRAGRSPQNRCTTVGTKNPIAQNASPTRPRAQEIHTSAKTPVMIAAEAS